MAAVIGSALAEPIGINFGAGRPDASLDAAIEAGIIPQVN